MQTGKWITNFAALVLIIGWVGLGHGQGSKQIKKEFTAKETVKIKLVLGGCRIEKSQDNKIHVNVDYSYADDEFSPKILEKENSLVLQEKFSDDNPTGESHWLVGVPDNCEIDFESATGELAIHGAKLEIKGNTGTGAIEIIDASGEFDLNTGTGPIQVSNTEGEIEVNSGTGPIKIEKSKGTVNANSGTGKVVAFDITIVDEGEFNSGTGDVEIKLVKGEDFDLSLNSGTGDALLAMDGQPLQGYFEMTAHTRKGAISAPVKFDREEEIKENGSSYARKSFTKGKDSPRYFIKTGTGKAKLTR